MALRSPKWQHILEYPIDFGSVPNEECNGCGPKNFGKLVDDYICGVNIRESAIIHDASWYLKYPQKEADKMFLRNMMKQIRREFNYSKRIGARMMAYWYYSLVRVGGLFFYD